MAPLVKVVMDSYSSKTIIAFPNVLLDIINP